MHEGINLVDLTLSAAEDEKALNKLVLAPKKRFLLSKAPLLVLIIISNDMILKTGVNATPNKLDFNSFFESKSCAFRVLKHTKSHI
jgi:hypothetical protein